MNLTKNESKDLDFLNEINWITVRRSRIYDALNELVNEYYFKSYIVHDESEIKILVTSNR